VRVLSNPLPPISQGCVLAFVLLGFPYLATGYDQRAILELVVNEVEKGEILVILRGSEIMATVSDLDRAGLRRLGGRRENINGQDYVSLSSLAPAVTSDMDEKELLLRLTAQPDFLGEKVFNLHTGAPVGITYGQDTSGFLNYAVNWRDFRSFDGFGEAGLSIRGNLLFSSFSRNTDGRIVRGQTNLTVDDRPSLTRWVVGDKFVNSDILGGSVFLGGVSASREFNLDPYFIRYPTFGFSNAVLSPSTAEIYVNGLLVRREQLPPGQFELKDLPVPAGAGVTRVVVRDAFGREQQVVSPFYFTTGILRSGLHEYSYNLGFRRNNIGNASTDYSSLALLGRHRIGLTDSITAGLRLEGGSHLASGGPTVTVRLPSELGEIQFSAAVSYDSGKPGTAAALGYNYLGQALGFGGSVRGLSARYANLSLRAADERASLETNAFVTFPLGSRTSATLQQTFTHSHSQDQSQRISLSTSTRINEYLNFIVNGGNSRKANHNEGEGFVGLNFLFGAASSTVFHQQRGHESNAGVGVQKSLPVGSGLGYRFQNTISEQQNQVNGLVQYQGPYGRYEADYNHGNGQNGSILSAAGGVAVIGGTVHFTRPVEESFALIRVPGTPGVRGYMSNQEIGTTDSSGTVLVPNLLSYYGNLLGIADRDIPLDRRVDATEKIIAPPYRGGVVVDFPVYRIQSVTGSIILQTPTELIIPAYGQLTVTADAKRFESPIGKQGEFYFESVPPGRHTAMLEYDETTCRFSVDVPASDASVLKLSTLRCVVQ
jgi:outer membrane usher protein